MGIKKIGSRFWVIIIFVVLYSLFVFFVNYTFEHYTEVLGATVFFFALFTGFFISRQNDRFSKVYTIMADQDAIFSYLYRIAGFFPEIQNRVREIAIDHYLRIKKSGNWAYHIDNPSTTITDLTNAFGEMDSPQHIERAEKPAMSAGAEIVWDGIKDLQVARKELFCLKNQKLLFPQWFIVYILAFILVVAFNFIPSPKEMFVDILKVFFGTAVFMVLILLNQLNDLSLFGKDFAQKVANDVFWIVEERDKKEKGILDSNLEKKIKETRKKIEESIAPDIK